MSERDLRILALLRAGVRGTGRRRHPAEVTSDRLGDALDRWPDAFDGMVGRIRHCLEQIAEGGSSP